MEREQKIYQHTQPTLTKQSAAILYLWHGAEMAVTMICIGMPVCRPAVSSVLHAIGLSGGPAGLTGRATHGSSRRGGGGGARHQYHGNIHRSHRVEKSGGSGSKGGAASSYIRNFSSGTWEDAVGAHDVDSWSQRRILGVGEATSGVVAGGGAGAVAEAGRRTASSDGRDSKEGGGAGGGQLGNLSSHDGDAEDVAVVDDDDDDNNDVVAVGFPMRTMTKAGGITVTRTVDITNGRKDSLSGRRP